MYNKKPLREAIKNLDRTKAPAKKKDMIVDPMGQWKYPGQNTRIPGNDITMQGVPYPVWAVPNVGTPQMMYPEQDYYFPGADHVDEYPQIAETGGDISIPDLNQYEDGGEYDLTDDEIAKLKAGGYIIEELPKAQTGDVVEKTLPEVTVTPAGYKGPVGAPTVTGFIPRKTPAQVQREELAKGKGPTREAAAKVKQAAAKPKKLTAEEQALKEQKAAADLLINRGYAAEMYGDKYYNQESQNPLSLEDYLLNDPNVIQNVKNAEYNIAKKNEAKRYQNAPWYDKVLNEAQTFIVDPLGTPVRWAQGKRSLMGQAYRQLAPDDFSDTEFYKKEAGIDPDNILYSVTDMFNPLTTGASAGYSFTKGDIGSGALDLGLYFTGLKGLKKLKKHARPLTSGLNIALKNFNNLAEEKKGGSLPNIPKKKGSKGYSRSPLATNRLFAQNPLLKKPKSKKRKIFDPNAKYYQDGGERDTIWNQNLAKDDKEFQDWYWNNSQALEAGSGIPYSEDFAYDYYSYFKNKDHLDTQGNPTDHYIDKYKRPQHPVFSDQSLYSTPENPGGHWETINGEEVLIPHQGLSLTKRNKKLGGFQDDINKHRDLLRDWTYGQSIGMLQKAQQGGPKPQAIQPGKPQQQIYSYAGREDAVYTKDAKGDWLIKTPGTGMKWQPIDDPTGDRTNLLNKQARPLGNTAKVAKNEKQMAIVNAKRKENILKNLRNEVKVFENEEKYLPHHKVDIGESTRVDTGINKQFTQSKHEAKRERIEDIKKVLNQEAERERIGKERSAYLKTPEAMFESQIKKKADWEKRASGTATPQDWVWTLPLAASSAGRSAIVAASELYDIPATIAGTEYSTLTAGNVIRGYYTQEYLKQWPSVLKKMASAKTTDENISALREFTNTMIGSSPIVKWNNALYSNLSMPFGLAENTRKYIFNEDLDPVGSSANALRSLAALIGKKQDGGDVWEDEIDDETRAELEAQGYIIEDLD